MATPVTTFIFPTLKLKKSKVDSLDYKRLCFQFVIGKNNVCTLLAYKLNQTRGCKNRTRVIELEIYKGTDFPIKKIGRKALFVQLELTVEQVGEAIEKESDQYLWFLPMVEEVQGYKYVIYHIGRNAASGDGGTYTSPCPPAKPPASGPEGGE